MFLIEESYRSFSLETTNLIVFISYHVKRSRCAEGDSSPDHLCTRELLWVHGLSKTGGLSNFRTVLVLKNLRVGHQLRNMYAIAARGTSEPSARGEARSARAFWACQTVLDHGPTQATALAKIGISRLQPDDTQRTARSARAPLARGKENSLTACERVQVLREGRLMHAGGSLLPPTSAARATVIEVS